MTLAVPTAAPNPASDGNASDKSKFPAAKSIIICKILYIDCYTPSHYILTVMISPIFTSQSTNRTEPYLCYIKQNKYRSRFF